MATRRKTSKKPALSRKEQAASAPPRSFWLSAWMIDLQISTERLAEKLGVDRVTVWRYETGERQPRKGMIARIAAALGIKPADLWRQPGAKIISLDAAAAHITDNAVREALVELIKKYPAS